MGCTHALARFLRSAAGRVPSRTAVVCGGEQLSYVELLARSQAMADALDRRGVKRGDIVVTWMEKSVDVVAVDFAALQLGAAYAPLNADAPPAHVAAASERARARILVVDAIPPPEVIAMLPGVELVTAAALRADGDGSREIDVEVAASDLAYLHFTSGSTGEPKAVAISHGAAIAYMDVCDEILRGGPDEVVANHAPLAFDLASFDIHIAVRWGATLHMLRTRDTLAPGSMLRFFAEAAPTLMYTVPTTLHRLAALSSIERACFPSLRALVYAGEPPNPHLLRKLRPVFPNATFHHWYGSTEAALVTATAAPPGAPLDDPPSIGHAVSGAELALRDEDGTWHPIVPGATGELLVAAPLLFEGYYNDAAATAKAFADKRIAKGSMRIPIGNFDEQRGGGATRWFATGDVVRCEAAGLYYLNRVDRLVKVRGHRVDLAGIGELLGRHPAVSSCVVVARQDPRAGVRLFAFVVGAQHLEADVRAFAEAHLPRYMVPEKIVWVRELPTTPSGKIDHRQLSQRIDVATPVGST